MKKFVIIIMILTILVSCTNSNSKLSEEVSCQSTQQFNEFSDNFKVIINETAKTIMLNELSKSSNAGKIYSIKYSYSGSG